MDRGARLKWLSVYPDEDEVRRVIRYLITICCRASTLSIICCFSGFVPTPDLLEADAQAEDQGNGR